MWLVSHLLTFVSFTHITGLSPPISLLPLLPLPPPTPLYFLLNPEFTPHMPSFFSPPLHIYISLIVSLSATHPTLTPPFLFWTHVGGGTRRLHHAAAQCHVESSADRPANAPIPLWKKMIVLALTKHQSMAAAILLEVQSNVVSRSIDRETGGEDNSQGLTSAPVSIVEQTLALYCIMLQGSGASASANIPSFSSELGRTQKCTPSCFASLVVFSPTLPFHWNQICVGFFCERRWAPKQ